MHCYEEHPCRVGQRRTPLFPLRTADRWVGDLAGGLARGDFHRADITGTGCCDGMRVFRDAGRQACFTRMDRGGMDVDPGRSKPWSGKHKRYAEYPEHV